MELTVPYAVGYREGDVLWITNRRFVVDHVDGTTISVVRPILGHWIAWFFLGLIRWA